MKEIMYMQNRWDSYYLVTNVKYLKYYVEYNTMYYFFDMIDHLGMLCKLKSWSLEDWSHMELLALMFCFNKAQNPSGSKKINETIL